jgi:hypothetical protein
MTNQNTTIVAGLIMMAAILSVSVTYSTAFAQESEREMKLDKRPLHTGTYLVGSGAAISEDDNAMRSHFRMGIVETQTNDNGHTEYEVKRGVFVVAKHDQRQHFSVIADSWEVSVSPNQKSFDASGTVENQEGKVFDVELSGEEISNLEHGTLYFVTGTATNDDGEVYELFYISPLVERIPSIPSTSDGI